MRKLKIFGILCLLSYCTAFVAFATSTMRQPQAVKPPVAKTAPLAKTEVLAAPMGISAQAPSDFPTDFSVKASAYDTPSFDVSPAQETSHTGRDQNISVQRTPIQIDDSTPMPSLALPVPLNAPAPQSQVVPAVSIIPSAPLTPAALTSPAVRPTTLSLPQPVKTSLQQAVPQTPLVQKLSAPTNNTNFTVPLPSGNSMAFAKNVAPYQKNIISSKDSMTRGKNSPLATAETAKNNRETATSARQVIESNSAELQLALLPVPSGSALVNAVSLQPEERKHLSQSPQTSYQLQLAIPKMFSVSPALTSSASHKQTLALVRHDNLLQQNRKKQTLLKSIFPVVRSPYSDKIESPSQPNKGDRSLNTALMLPLGPSVYVNALAAYDHAVFDDPSTPMVSKLENDQPRLPLPSQEPLESATPFPLVYHHSSTNNFFEATKSLQSITLTPGGAPASSQTGVSGLPIPATKTPMKNQPTAYHQADKKKTFQLTNGLKVILQQDDRFPLVSLRLYVHAGSAYETSQQAGISHVLEHMVFKGSRHYGDGEIAREVENSGGYLNAFTSFDQTGYVVDLPSSHWEKGLSVLKEMAFLPLFNKDHLASEKEVIVSELKRGKDSPGNVLFTQIIADMFNQSPYAHPIIGFEDTIRATTVESLNDYHQQWYQPQATILVVCGNIDLEKVEKQITKEFSEFTNNKALTQPNRAVTPPTKPVVNIQTGPWQKIRLTLAFHAPTLKDNKAVQLDLLTHMIGGDQTSPLFKKYKYDKRLVDSISMQNYNFEESGLVFVMATLDAHNIKPFWQELLVDMQQGFTFEQDDLARAQLALQDSFYRSRETLEGYASQIGHFNFYFNGEADAQNYLANVANTDLATLKNLYAEIFQPQSAGIFGITPVDLAFEGSKKDQSLADWLVAELDKRWQAAPLSTAKASATSPSEQEIIPLENGCSLVLLPDATLPYISATLLFDGGESLLTPATQGLGALTAGTLTRGTASRDYAAIQTFLSERAATLTASSNRQTFGISFSSPSQFTHDIFELTSDVINNPLFLVEETDRVKENIQAAIIRSEEQPISLAFRHLTAFLYPTHSYGFLQLGTPESIDSFTHKTVQKHWENQKRYPWTLSLCGDFSKDDILALVKKLPKPTKTLSPLPTPVLTKEKELSLTLAEREQAHLFLIFPIPGTNAPDEASLELLTTILAGQSGLLFSELRDKQGLGYSVTAFPWKTQKAGALIFYIGTEPKSVDVAYNGFTKIIDSLKTKPLQLSLLERGKNILAGEYYRERQSLGARSSEGATFTALGLPLDFKLSLIEQSQLLTPQDILQAAQTYLKLEKSFIIKVLPKNSK